MLCVVLVWKVCVRGPEFVSLLQVASDSVPCTLDWLSVCIAHERKGWCLQPAVGLREWDQRASTLGDKRVHISWGNLHVVT